MSQATKFCVGLDNVEGMIFAHPRVSGGIRKYDVTR